MNERIRKLALQAGFYSNPDIEKFEKFTQLIVEECAQRAEAYAYMGPDFSALAEELRRMTEDEESEEDSACRLCGFDGGTTCGIPNCQY